MAQLQNDLLNNNPIIIFLKAMLKSVAFFILRLSRAGGNPSSKNRFPPARERRNSDIA